MTFSSYQLKYNLQTFIFGKLVSLKVFQVTIPSLLFPATSFASLASDNIDWAYLRVVSILIQNHNNSLKILLSGNEFSFGRPRKCRNSNFEMDHFEYFMLQAYIITYRGKNSFNYISPFKNLIKTMSFASVKNSVYLINNQS